MKGAASGAVWGSGSSATFMLCTQAQFVPSFDVDTRHVVKRRRFGSCLPATWRRGRQGRGAVGGGAVGGDVDHFFLSFPMTFTPLFFPFSRRLSPPLFLSFLLTFISPRSLDVLPPPLFLSTFTSLLSPDVRLPVTPLTLSLSHKSPRRHHAGVQRVTRLSLDVPLPDTLRRGPPHYSKSLTDTGRRGSRHSSNRHWTPGFPSRRHV